jgi:hypothetical protein
MMMNMEQSVEGESVGKTEAFGENLPQSYFVHLTWDRTQANEVGSQGLAA